jgi:hypothetical protein
VRPGVPEGFCTISGELVWALFGAALDDPLYGAVLVVAAFVVLLPEEVVVEPLRVVVEAPFETVVVPPAVVAALVGPVVEGWE